MGNVLGSVKVSFKDQAKAHGVAAQGRCVHRRPQRVLQGSTDTEQGLSCCTRLQTAGASRRQHWLQKVTAFGRGVKIANTQKM